MRTFIFLPLFALITACSSNQPAPERSESAPPEEKHAASQTDQCLDNPELSRSWGECNVKHTVYLASDQLEKCRKANPSAKGTVNFDLRIKADGKVKSAKPEGGKHGKHTACVAKVLRKLQFASPPKGKEATISVPYQLEP